MHRILQVGGKAFISLRTTDDYRYGKGTQIEDHTYMLNIDETNEKGMVMHFLDRAEINDTFKDFSELVVEKLENTFSNLQNKNSDWLILVKK
jgi:hypothetical protein